ncbi:MAG: hypothetical protein NTY38_09900 [Acidobacteria bacterium]|nr:hypothetical protein [Acidobacteriota bacterium]
MEKMTLRRIRSELHYRGGYGDIAFELLSAPAPLYKALVKHLGQFGGNLQNLSSESPSLADTHVSCRLPELNVVIRVRIDRVELDFWKLHEMSADIAHRIVLATWAAVREADNSVDVASHFVDLAAIAETEGANCAALMSRYLMTPEALGAVDTGVGFYSRPVQEGHPWVNLVLDRVFGHDDQVSVKVTMGFSAAEAALDTLAVYVDNIAKITLDKVGLQFATDHQK